MKKITFTNVHRRKHFDFFLNMDAPHFNITANVEITPFLKSLKAHQQPFTPAVVYALAHTANSIQEFRWRIRNGEVVEHEWVHPSFTVNTDIADVFSFCTVEYSPDYKVFTIRAKAKMEKMKEDPSFEDEEGRDDYLFISAIPWVTFTGFMHPMHYHPVDSVPRFAFGKYFEQNAKYFMPISVQAHHAIVDGVHVGRYFQKIEKLFCEEFEKIIEDK